MPCKSDIKGRMCGGEGNLNSVYDLSGVANVDYKPGSVVNESYIGCFEDKKEGRDLPNIIKEGYGNYKKCFVYAAVHHYKYAGL